MTTASELRRIENNLLPTTLLARARGQTLSAFVRPFVGTLVLLIKVDDDQGDLRVGLDESTAEVPPLAPRGDGIGFSTAVDPEELRGMLATSSLAMDATELRKRLSLAAYFALPIKKRELGAKPFAGKISVGRARNNDIVLRHATVSKFHAWFEVEDGRVTISDARSKNHTWMGGEALQPNEPVLVEPGRAVRFGRVTTLVVSADLLWKAAIGN